MNSEANTEIKVLVFVPLSPSARELMAEAMIVVRTLRATPLWLSIGEDSRARREMIHSLLPRGTAMSSENLVIREGDPEEQIAKTADSEGVDVVLLGPIHGKSNDVALSLRAVTRLSRRLKCSVLLFPECRREGTRIRQIVCGVEFNNQSRAMLDFVQQFARLCFASKIHVVKEFDPEASRTAEGNKSPASTREWQKSEEYLLDEFLQDFELEHPPVGRAVVQGQESAAVASYAAEVKGDLIVLTLDVEEPSSWDPLFKDPLKNLLGDLPCPLLLYRGEALADRLRAKTPEAKAE